MIDILQELQKLDDVLLAVTSRLFLAREALDSVLQQLVDVRDAAELAYQSAEKERRSK